MQNEEKPNLTLAPSNDKDKVKTSVMERAFNNERLIAEYECGIEAKPEWCVFGNDGNGGATVLFWIRPSPESELVAHKIAKYLKSLGTLVGVEMTEWNRDIKDTPIYAQTAAQVSKRIDWNT